MSRSPVCLGGTEKMGGTDVSTPTRSSYGSDDVIRCRERSRAIMTSSLTWES